MKVDDGFARLVLQHASGARDARARLLQHPASAAILRHRRLLGDTHTTVPSIVDDILAQSDDARAVASMLDRLAGEREALSHHAELALEHLPPGTSLDGHIHLIVGYDIGIAAPPDVAINVAHAHFLANPSEVVLYVTHEAHHVGFMAARPPPSLAALDDPCVLREVVAYFTELEGRAVHAAHDPRARLGALAHEEDYLVYRDANLAAKVTARFAELWQRLQRLAPLGDDDVGAIMKAMSSGERLFYRVGALVCDRIERERGRVALAMSVRDGEAFTRELEHLLARRPLRTPS